MKLILAMLLVCTCAATAVQADEADDQRKAEIRYIRMVRAHQRRLHRLQKQANGAIRLQRMINAQYMPQRMAIYNLYRPRYIIIVPRRPIYYPRYYY